MLLEPVPTVRPWLGWHLKAREATGPDGSAYYELRHLTECGSWVVAVARAPSELEADRQALLALPLPS